MAASPAVQSRHRRQASACNLKGHEDGLVSGTIEMTSEGICTGAPCERAARSSLSAREGCSRPGGWNFARVSSVIFSGTVHSCEICLPIATNPCWRMKFSDAALTISNA